MFLNSEVIKLLRIYEIYGTEKTFEDFLHNICSEKVITTIQLAKYIKYYQEVINK